MIYLGYISTEELLEQKTSSLAALEICLKGINGYASPEICHNLMLQAYANRRRIWSIDDELSRREEEADLQSMDDEIKRFDAQWDRVNELLRHARNRQVE